LLAGIHVLTDEYMRAARRLCDEAGAKLVFDEVQSVSRCSHARAQ
jgi:acetylornithine/succinyldiaminopimelate/putrescine aminotransferase